METESSLPIPPSSPSAPAAAPLADQPPVPQAAMEQPATSDQPAAAPHQAGLTDEARPAAAAAEAQQAQAGASTQQQSDGVDTAAGPTADAMQEQSIPPAFTPGTVLRFDMEADNVADSTTLDFRAIRPVFGGKEGGVRHCEYRRVRCQCALSHLASH